MFVGTTTTKQCSVGFEIRRVSNIFVMVRVSGCVSLTALGHLPWTEPPHLLIIHLAVFKPRRVIASTSANRS